MILIHINTLKHNQNGAIYSVFSLKIPYYELFYLVEYIYSIIVLICLMSAPPSVFSVVVVGMAETRPELYIYVVCRPPLSHLLFFLDFPAY